MVVSLFLDCSKRISTMMSDFAPRPKIKMADEIVQEFIAEPCSGHYWQILCSLVRRIKEKYCNKLQMRANMYKYLILVSNMGADENDV